MLVGAYEGESITSEFQSLKHVERVGAVGGPMSHSLTKKASERNEEMGAEGESVLERALRQEGGREMATCSSIHSYVQG